MKLKVTKGELIISNHLEMADGYIQWWLPVPPPSLVRVKTAQFTLQKWGATQEAENGRERKIVPLEIHGRFDAGCNDLHNWV